MSEELAVGEIGPDDVRRRRERVIAEELDEFIEATGGWPLRSRIEWDIDANVPMYTRDYLQLEKEKEHLNWHLTRGDSICTCGRL